MKVRSRAERRRRGRIRPTSAREIDSIRKNGQKRPSTESAGIIPSLPHDFYLFCLLGKIRGWIFDMNCDDALEYRLVYWIIRVYFLGLVRRTRPQVHRATENKKSTDCPFKKKVKKCRAAVQPGKSNQILRHLSGNSPPILLKNYPRIFPRRQDFRVFKDLDPVTIRGIHGC